MDNYDIFESINLAIKEATNKKIDVKRTLGTDLIKILDEMHCNFYFEDNETFNEHVKKGYDESVKLLDFELIA